MRHSILSTILCCASLAPAYAGESSYALENISESIAPRSIHVLLQKDATEALLEVKGPYYVTNPHDGSRVASGLLGKRFMIRELDNGLKWGEEYPGVHQVTIVPRSADTSILIDGIQYSGSVTIYGVSSQINIVNELSIEDYVKSILSTKFASPIEPEALAALAIVARTDAYYHASRAQNGFWDVAASDEGFCGSALNVNNSPVDKAVESTKHLVLVHPMNGQNLPFAASWTEHSAGKTAAYQALFRKEGMAPDHGVDAPHAALNRSETKWTYTLSKKALAQHLDLNQIKSVELFIDQPSGKVYGLRIKDSDGSQDFDFLSLQQAIGANHLRSSDFTLSVKDDAVTFTGYGRGHGVGLCLYSASALAQNGENAIKILSKFFPETYLYNLNANAR